MNCDGEQNIAGQQESLLYFPAVGGLPRHTSQNPKRYRSPSEHGVPFETHMIQCADGVTIHSWLLYQNAAGPDGRAPPTIVFFHGNAGNIGMRLPNAMQMYHYLRANVWLVEYRGFGDSDDAPINEAGLKMDAEAVWDYAHGNKLRGVDPRRLFVFGRSLGGAVAFHMAQYSQSMASLSTNHPPLAGVIVENTFLSISEMVDHLLPYLAPFKMLILRMDWNSGKIAPSIRIPTLFLAGAKDALVPHSHMLELFSRMKQAASAGRGWVSMHVVEDGTHNETYMQGGRAYWKAFRKFIDEALAAEQAGEYGRGANAGSDGAMGTVGGGPIQGKGSLTATAPTSSATKVRAQPTRRSSRLNPPDVSPSDGEGDAGRKGSVEVDMGCEGEDAADMISSVGNFMGMAREAVKGTYKKKD